jgi:hypothetical protein
MTMEAQAPARRKPGPKPGSKRQPAQQAAAVETLPPQAEAQTTAEPAPVPPAPPAPVVEAAPAQRIDPLQRHRNIQTMSEDELRVYARQVGVSQRDANELSVDRLRVNCVHMVHAIIAEL